VKKVIEGMTTTETPVAHVNSVVPIIPIALEVAASIDNVVFLVQLVKSIREMGYGPYLG
jgi:hypothetical protein